MILGDLDLDANMRCAGNGIFMQLTRMNIELAGIAIAPGA